MKKLLSLLLSFAILATPALDVSAKTITVQSGDTLSKLAVQNGTTVRSLVSINKISNPNLIRVGQKLETDAALGANIPTVIAVYTDSLASRISNTASSFVLVRGTDKQSRNLSGFYGFVMDEGTTSEEFVTANCVATACTIVARGIDVVDGETPVTALKFEHRRGATVKISNFPQLALLSRILSGLESASSTFMFGDGTTTSTLNKYLKVDNGTANLPFLRYNETLGKWQFSDDGLNTITFATSSASGLSASTTKGTFITDSQIGVNASTTKGLTFDSDGKVGISASSTGGINFASGGQVQVDQSDNFNFTGTVTTTGSLRVQYPVIFTDAASKGYADLEIRAFSATGTAYSTVTAGQALYTTATSSLGVITTSSGTSTYAFVGFARVSAAAGAEVSYTRPGGLNCSQSGLVPGTQYYLNGTSGQISTTPGTAIARVGLALTATCLEVTTPKYIAYGTITLTGVSDASTNVTTINFYPAHLTLKYSNFTGNDQSPVALGWSDDAGLIGLATNASFGDRGGNSGSAYYYRNSTEAWTGGITKSATGFTLTNTRTAGSGTLTLYLQYTAESL